MGESRWYSQRCGYCGTTLLDRAAIDTHFCRADVMQIRAEKQNRESGMANIILCDRCGQIATAKVAGGLDYWPNPDGDRKTYGLCPNCSRELYEWLTGADRDVRAIMAPFDPDKVETPQGPTQKETSRAALDAEYGDRE